MNRFKLTTDIIYNSKAKKDLTIVHISDIHFSKITKPKMLNRLINYVNSLNPDYIMITGDTLDVPWIVKEHDKMKELWSFFDNLSHITKVLISIGNHDVLSNEDFDFFSDLDKIDNIYVLNNTSYHDEYIYTMGITLPGDYYYNVTHDESLEVLLNSLDNLKVKLSKMPKHVPKIALIHSPIKLTEKSTLERLRDFDIILCGHTHNGMVPDCINFLFRANRGIISPRNNLFPKIAKGKINTDINNHKITIIINGGITKLSKQSGKILSNLNFIYNKSVNKIIIRKKRGNKDE